MKIRMKSLAASIDGVLFPDHVYDLPETQAKALVEGGYADAVAEKAPSEPETPKARKTAKRETATAGKREKAVKE